MLKFNQHSRNSSTFETDITFFKFSLKQSQLLLCLRAEQRIGKYGGLRYVTVSTASARDRSCRPLSVKGCSMFLFSATTSELAATASSIYRKSTLVYERSRPNPTDYSHSAQQIKSICVKRCHQLFTFPAGRSQSAQSIS